MPKSKNTEGASAQEIAALKLDMEHVNTRSEEIRCKVDSVEEKVTALSAQMSRIEALLTADRGQPPEREAVQTEKAATAPEEPAEPRGHSQPPHWRRGTDAADPPRYEYENTENTQREVAQPEYIDVHQYQYQEAACEADFQYQHMLQPQPQYMPQPQPQYMPQPQSYPYPEQYPPLHPYLNRHNNHTDHIPIYPDPYNPPPQNPHSRVSLPDPETSGDGTEREAKKKIIISLGEEIEVAQAGDDEAESVAQSHGLTKVVEEDDFTPKSPISMPYIPDELNDPTAYPATLAAFNEAHVKYKAKLSRRYQLFSLPPQPRLASSCLFNHRHLLPIRESAQKAVLHVAKSIIRLSSSVDGKPLANCCGLWIKWDEESKTGIVLTTAHLIRSNHPTENHWEGKDEYNIKSQVIVHLLDGNTADGHYLYHQEHYDLAFFKVRVDEKVEVPHFSASMNCGQDVFRLGRDDHMNLRITHGRVEYLNPGSDERHHYMYFFHQKNDSLSHQRHDDRLPNKKNDDYLCDDDGGSVIDLDGKVAGLFNKHLEESFVPSSILDKCVDLWCKFRCIPRLHLGMNFISIKLLDPIHIEMMCRMYKIEDGLIVKEVSKESHAEKLGICLGDIIERFNGELISTTVELEKMLLGRCRDHFDQGGHLNEKINISIQVFHTEERLRRNINLSVDVSDGGEVINRRTYPITAIEGTSASGQSSQHVADDPCLPRRERTWESYCT